MTLRVRVPGATDALSPRAVSAVTECTSRGSGWSECPNRYFVSLDAKGATKQASSCFSSVTLVEDLFVGACVAERRLFVPRSHRGIISQDPHLSKKSTQQHHLEDLLIRRVRCPISLHPMKSPRMLAQAGEAIRTWCFSNGVSPTLWNGTSTPRSDAHVHD